jgi:DNA-binding GntR family transcriptional regulator
MSLNDIHQSLRMQIITGTLPPSTRLTEEELADKFGVSRTPVREALRMLERDGLIRVSRGRGATVVSLSRQEIIDTYQCRGTLRGLACRLAAEKMTPETLARLRQVLASLEDAVAREDIDTIFISTVQFNQIITQVAGNAVLVELLATLDDRTLRIRFTAHTIPERVRFALAAYKKMYTALAAGDGKEAEAIALSITQNAMEAILKVYYPIVPGALAQPRVRTAE